MSEIEEFMKLIDTLKDYDKEKFAINNDYTTLLNRLNNTIFGQEHVIEEVLNTIMIAQAGLHDTTKPIGSFLFAGATGTGKTELAKELAKTLNMEFIRFDMSEYSDEYSARNLTGGQKGLVGYEEGGLLTNAVLEEPRSVVLFDEIEKADKAVYKVFLQILDYATLTDTKGDKVDFTQTIIIMTSNLGANAETEAHQAMGFLKAPSHQIDTTKPKYEAIVDFFTPEMRARIEKILYFRELDDVMVEKIIDKFINEFMEMVKNKGILLKITPQAKQLLLDEFKSSEKEGARAVIKIINTQLKQSIAKMIITQELVAGDNVIIDAVENRFTFQKKSLVFSTHEEACQYARENIGVVVTRADDGEGYKIKEFGQNMSNE